MLQKSGQTLKTKPGSQSEPTSHVGLCKMEGDEVEELDTLATRKELDSQSLASQDQVSATAFLQHSGLGFLAQPFKQAGFQSVADVLTLTPRKYATVGVDLQVGTRLRLERL